MPATAQVNLPAGNDLRAILRIRAFRRLWLVLGLSSLGDWLGLLATATFASAQVSSSAGKGLAFGSVIAVRLLPALVLGPMAGVLVDRFDRRYTMVVCDILRFLLFASIPTVGMVSHNPAVTIGWTAVATFIIESISMVWTPAKEASVPNLIGRTRLERANQLTLVTTYGIAPVAAAAVLGGLNAGLRVSGSWSSPADIALYFNALTFLASALTVLFGIPEISGRDGGPDRAARPGLARQFIEGWKYVGRTPLVRGLVLGILGAFAGGGVVVGTATFYAKSLGGGDATFAILFAVLFIGLGLGIVLGPRVVGPLSRRRWFGLSIVLAGGSTIILAAAPHVTIAVFGTLLVGGGAGMAFLSGITLLGGEVSDDVRGRVFAFVWTAVRVVLMLAITLSSIIVGVGGSRQMSVVGLNLHVSATRLLLLAAGLLGLATGVSAFRQMDDKPGVPVLRDLWGSVRGRPLGIPEGGPTHGLFIVFEGGEGAGKSTQAVKLAAWLKLQGYSALLTREPGATDVGMRIRGLLLDGTGPMSPRAEALLYAADRAHHVSAVVRPALADGDIVISDRYVDSSLAYQGGGRTLPVDEISWLSGWATGGLKPDLVVLLDVDPAEGLGRAGSRGAADRLERESLAFHERVRESFLDLAADDPGRYLVVDASRSADDIAELVRARVATLLPERPPGRPDDPAPADDTAADDTAGDYPAADGTAGDADAEDDAGGVDAAWSSDAVHVGPSTP